MSTLFLAAAAIAQNVPLLEQSLSHDLLVWALEFERLTLLHRGEWELRRSSYRLKTEKMDGERGRSSDINHLSVVMSGEENKTRNWQAISARAVFAV